MSNWWENDPVSSGAPGEDQFWLKDPVVGESAPPVATANKDRSWSDAVSEFGVDVGKRIGGALVGGVASMPLGAEKGIKAAVRGAVTGGAETVMPSSVFMPGLDTDEAVFGPETGRDKLARSIAGERAASGVPSIPFSQAVSDLGGKARESIQGSASQATRDAVAKSQITGNIFKGEMDFGKDPSVRGFVMQAADVFGSMLPVVATALITKNPNAGAVVGGSMAAGEGANSAQEFITKKTDAELQAQSPFFAKMIEAGASPAEARKLTVDRASESAAALQGLVASFGDRFTGKLVTGQLDGLIAKMAGKSAVSKVVAGGVLSGAEEGIQEVSEGVASDVGVSSVVPSKEIGEDSAANLVLGALGGGPTGAGRGAYSAWEGRKPAEANPENPPNTPAVPVTQPAQPVMGQGAGGSQPTQVAPIAQTAAEKSLLTPVALTGLDRVNELDTELAPVRQRLAELTPENGYGPMFDQERLDLTAQAATLDQERADLSKDWPKSVPGIASSFTTEAGARVEAQYVLMDAGDLITSHDEGLRKNPLYPQELQPRERERAASEMQVAAINQKLDPAKLGWSADAATGAPIVGADGLVESGNARTIALKRVYQAGGGQKAEDYKQFLRDNATQFGIPPGAIDAMAKPVLVRVRSTPVNRAEFARQANASTVAQMSPSEQAKSDSSRIDTMEDLMPDDSGDFSNAGSRPFVRRFMARLPITEQAGMIDANGDLSTSGYARVRNAVLAKAYGDSPVLARMTESMDDNLRNVSKAMMMAAPKVAQMREAVSAGNRFDADITPDLMSAVEELSRLKDDGGSVQDALAQTDLMGDQRSPESGQLLQFLSDNMRRPRKMADFISAYMDALDAAGDPNQGSMFGDTQAPAKTDLLTAATKATSNEIQDGGPKGAGPAQKADGEIQQQSQDAQGRGGGAETNGVSNGPSENTDATGQPGAGGVSEGARAAAVPSLAAVDTEAVLRASAVQDAKDALNDLALIASKHTRLLMLPENTPGLMPALVKLFSAAIRIVGSDLRAATKWVKSEMKSDSRTKPIWNLISNETYQKAALQALENPVAADQSEMFAQPVAGADQGGLFSEPAGAAPVAPEVAPVVAKIEEIKPVAPVVADQKAIETVAIQEQDPAPKEQEPAPEGARAGSTKIEDIGEKIGGARKDKWKDRGLDLSDLDGMSESEGAEMATKTNVWKPDYEAMAEAADPVTAAMVKTVYDQLAAQPKKNTPEGRRNYVNMMQAVRAAYLGAKSPQEVKDAGAKLKLEIGLYSTDPATKAKAREVLFSVYKGRSDPFVLSYNELSKAKKLVEDGFPAKGEPWKKRLSIRALGAQGFTPRGIELMLSESAELGMPLTTDQIVSGFYRINTKDGKAVGYAPTKEGAEAAAKTIYERDLKKGASDKPEPVRPNLDELKRENLPDRIDRDVTADDFVKEFGFRGVEFGNWAAQDERRRIINMAYDGLMDLAEIMGVPPKAMSLNGTMGMAFGARGGGKFAAHYEPGKLVINMTKINGGGSMAHEWAHALDHYFGELNQKDAYTTKARGASGWYDEQQYKGVPQTRMEKDAEGKWAKVSKMRLSSIRPEMAKAFDGVMSALFSGQETKAQMVRSEELSIERYQALATKETDSDTKAMYLRGIESRKIALEELRQDPEDKTYPKGRSSYAGQAQKLVGKSATGYWTRPTEMFARAFESWVFDKVAAMGARSDYLVHGVEEDRFAGGNYKGNPYPTGQERATINAAFDNLAGTIETKVDDAGNVAMFSSRESAPEKQLPLDQIERLVKSALRGVRDAPVIRVVASPEAIGLRPPVNAVPSGALLANGDIYVFQSGVGSALDVDMVVFHELFHKGLQNSMPSADYVAAMQEIAKADSKVRQYAGDWSDTNAAKSQLTELAKKYSGQALADQYEALATEEGLAMVAEDLKAKREMGTDPIRLRRLASWLAKLADKLGMTRLADSIRALSYTEAEKFVVRTIAKAGGSGQGTGVKFSSRDSVQTETPAFKKWFGDSKVVDSVGRPIEVFHGSVSKGISVFDTSLVTTRNKLGDTPGTYFTSSREAAAGYARAPGSKSFGEVVPAYLSIQNPLNTTADIKRLQKGGLSFGDAKRKALEKLAPEHDGVIFNGNGANPAEYVVFNPGQIKSATGNNGDFDSANPDIRMSRGDGGGMDVGVLEAMAARIQKRMPNMPKVNVLASPLDAPPALRAYIEKQGAMDDVDGAMHKGELYLFASGLPDVLRAEHVLAEHEAAHFGLRAILGDSLKGVMQSIYNNNAVVRQAASELQRRGALSNADATEEVIVDIPSSQLVKLQGWRKVVLQARDWLADHGFEAMAAKLSGWLDGKLSDQQRADLMVANLVRAARSYMAGKRVGPVKENTDTMLSGTEDLGGAALSRGAANRAATDPAAAGQTLESADSRADKLIMSPTAGTAQPLDAIAKAITKITGIERLTSAIYDKAGFWLDRKTPEVIKAGMVSDYGVPEAVIDQRAMMQGRQRVQLRKVGSLIEKLSTLTRDESRVAYAWMNEAEPDAANQLMKGLPEASVAVLKEVQQMIDRLSKEAVRMGQLSPEAYERNKFSYLSRSYEKHTLAQTPGEKTGRARAISILGNQYKGRGLTDEAVMAQIQSAAPDWWQRKTVGGKADTSLKGENLVRLERRAPSGERTTPIEGMEGKAAGKLLEVHYYPAGETMPTKYADWTQAGTFEVRDIKGAKAVLWRDFTKAEREKMGEIDEARFAIAKTLHAMVHDIEVGRYMEWLAHNYAKKEGETIPGVVVEASELYRDTFKKDDWVRVPDSKIAGTAVVKYGKLAGRYLPGPVWNDLRQTVNGQFRPFGDTYAKILGMWKTAKTALSPAVHTNNVMSSAIMADWHDVTAGHTAKALRILLGAHAKDKTGVLGTAGNKLAGAVGLGDREAARAVMDRYLDSGGNLGSWATNEVANQQIEPLLAAMEAELAATNGNSAQAQIGVFSALNFLRHGELAAAWDAAKGSKPGKAIHAEGTNLIDLYQNEDEVFRLAAWLKAKEEGKTDMQAGKISRQSFLDYNISAPWVQALRNSVLPFVSFSYRAVPMMLEIMGKKPHKLLKLMAFAGAVNAFGALMAGGDDDEERKLLPEEKAGKIWGMVPKLIRMPWNDENQSAVYLDIRRFIPVGDVLDVGAKNAAVPMLPMMMPGGPLVIIGEVVFNKSSFTAKPITLETDTAAEKAEKVLSHLYKAFAPNILGLPGTYATTNVVDTLAGDNGMGKTDKFGRELSTAQAIVSSFGIKLGSYPADVLRKNEQGRVGAMEREIDKNIGDLRRERQTNRIDQDEFVAKVRAQQEKKIELRREFLEKIK